MDRRGVLKSAVAAAVSAALWDPFASARMGRGALTSSSYRKAVLNPADITYYDNQQAFLNVLKQSGGQYSAWQTLNGSGTDTNEEVYLEQILDSSGYPTTLTLTTPPTGGQQFTQLDLGTLVQLATVPGVSNLYPSGNRRLRFQGKCTFTVRGDFGVAAQTLPAGITVNGLSGTIAAQAPGATVVSTNAWGTNNDIILTCATPSTSGFHLRLSALPDSANYFKGASLVETAYTSIFDGGQIFHPTYLSWLQSVPVGSLIMRFMDFLQTNAQVNSSQYTTYEFSTPPTAGSALPALAGNWPNQGGQRRITLSTGEELLATFTTGSTTVTSTANPTKTASDGIYYWFAYDSWSARPNVGDLTYATYKGVPYEICISLAAAIGSDAWLNLPSQFQSSDWASFTSLCQANITGSQKVFVEYSNEVWNTSFYQERLALAKSALLWGTGDVWSYAGMLTAQIADQIAATAGNPNFDNQFIVVAPLQIGNNTQNKDVLTTPSWTGNTPPWQRTTSWGTKTIKAACGAPYFGNGALYAADFTHMQGEGDGGYSDFFAQLTQNPVNGYTYHDWAGNALPSGGFYALAVTNVQNTVTVLSSYGSLPLYSYEGGWQFEDPNNAAGQESFLDTAARDSRMNALQYSYLTKMNAAGIVPGQLNFSNPYGGTQWGLIETPLQTETPLSSTPPRWQGFAQYVNGN